MPYELKGRLSLKLFFNGDEFPFERANSLDFLHVSSSTRIALPMLHLRLIDSVEFFSNSSYLADGTVITIVVQQGDSPLTRTMKFRLNSFKKPLIGQGSGYEFDAYLDHPIYWAGSQVNAIQGNSSSVLKQIATLCGLKFEGDSTSDSMSWIPRNRPYHEWARSISERGYKSEMGCMQLAVNSSSVMRYVDLQAETKPKAGLVFPAPKPGFFLITDFQPAAATGSINTQSVYGEQRLTQSTENASQRAYDTVKFRRMSDDGKAMINAGVKTAVSKARVRYAPISFGNQHEFYEQALYQNRRLSNAFSSRVDALSPEMTNLGVLDKVEVTLDFDQSSSPKIFNGNYFVTSHVIYVQGNNYYEKFELASNVLRNNSGTSL